MTQQNRTTKTRRAFEPETDLRIVMLKAKRHPYAYIGMVVGRSARSCESRFLRLEATGKAATMRDQLIETGLLLGSDA